MGVWILAPWIFIVGGCFFAFSYTFIRRFLNYMFPSYLSAADQYLIAEKCVSSLQAVLATLAGMIIAIKCRYNIMTDTYWLTNTYAMFGFAYFVYDVWAIYNTHYYLNEGYMATAKLKEKLSHFTKHNVSMLLHHAVLPLIFFPAIVVLRGDKGDYFVGVLYMCEAAIPFISLRFILAQLKMKQSVFYIISGLMMIFVFFIVRICVFPFLYWKYSEYSGIPFSRVPLTIPIKCNLGCSIILLVQFYFLYLMVRGAFKVFVKIYHQRKAKYG